MVAHAKEYQSWYDMVRRCLNPRKHAYERYGGRGITVAPQWLGPTGFQTFLADMGPRPPGGTIDRIDNNGNYEPGNCRWATLAEQQCNRRDSRKITVEGVTLTVTEWARKLGMCSASVFERLDRGWPEQAAVTLPKGARHPDGRQRRNRRGRWQPSRTGYRGVVTSHGKWAAFIGGHATREYLGTFNTPEAAARAYDEAARRRHGILARLNFPRTAVLFKQHISAVKVDG